MSWHAVMLNVSLNIINNVCVCVMPMVKMMDIDIKCTVHQNKQINIPFIELH